VEPRRQPAGVRVEPLRRPAGVPHGVDRLRRDPPQQAGQLQPDARLEPRQGARGNLVAYAGRDNSNRYDIFAVDVGSGKLTRITQNPGRNLDPTWSPDGRMIAFQSTVGGIVVANEQGNNQQPIAKAGTTPDWGPKAN
jgi:dipeptidyl aminopeptidase/acylaminoacyl peptidase